MTRRSLTVKKMIIIVWLQSMVYVVSLQTQICTGSMPQSFLYQLCPKQHPNNKYIRNPVRSRLLPVHGHRHRHAVIFSLSREKEPLLPLSQRQGRRLLQRFFRYHCVHYQSDRHKRYNHWQHPLPRHHQVREVRCR